MNQNDVDIIAPGAITLNCYDGFFLRDEANQNTISWPLNTGRLEDTINQGIYAFTSEIPTIVQSTGNSTTSVMSQNAVTNAITSASSNFVVNGDNVEAVNIKGDTITLDSVSNLTLTTQNNVSIETQENLDLISNTGNVDIRANGGISLGTSDGSITMTPADQFRVQANNAIILETYSTIELNATDGNNIDLQVNSTLGGIATYNGNEIATTNQIPTSVTITEI